ncbi:hypothetical protein ACHHV8_32715 [Paenibacillus sp. TAB 01]|uniref:hypothetical protein n=1 Tax=Paenibacillus sp. TAB 01 TaxID=3368988 RepID=UPI0037510407
MKELTLSECLTGLTKQNLTHIRTHLGIQGVSTLKKQELVEVLVQRIPEKLTELFPALNEKQSGIVRQVAGEGGNSELKLEEAEMEFFTQRAILFEETIEGKTWTRMPKEVLACFTKLETGAEAADGEKTPKVELGQEADETIRLAQGLLYYYGVQTLEQWAESMELYTGVKPAADQLLRIASAADELEANDRIVWHTRVQNPDEVLRQQQSRPELAFSPCTKEELLAAGEPGFIDRTPIYQNFVNLIKVNYTISRDEADDVIQECVYAIRNGKTSSDLFKMLQTKMDLDEVDLIKAVMEQTILLENHTRQSDLEGVYVKSAVGPKKIAAVRRQQNRNR